MNIITKSLNFNVTYIYDKKHYLTQKESILQGDFPYLVQHLSTLV